MQTYSNAQIIGRLGADPVYQVSPSGARVAQISVATDSHRKNSAGEWETVPNWHSCVAFEKRADYVKETLRKGDMVFLEGRLRESNWLDKTTGEKRYRTEIIVDVIFPVSAKQTPDAQLPGGASTSLMDDDPIENVF